MNTKNVQSERVQMHEPASKTLTHFHVYQNLNFVSDLQFEKGQITIGSSQCADLFLDHQSVAGIHALVDINKGKAILTNQFPENGLRLNGEPVHKARLQPEDVIAIGPFALKLKKTGQTDNATGGEQPIFFARLVNRYRCSEDRDVAAINLAGLLHVDLDKTTSLVSRDQFIIKRGISGLEAAQIQNTMLKAGVICDVQVDTQITPPIQAKAATDPTVEELPKPQPAESQKDDFTCNQATGPEEQEKTVEAFLFDEEDDEEEEELWEAPFSLEQELESSFLLPQKEIRNQVGKVSWRHWTASVCVHLTFLLAFFLYTVFQTAVPQKQALHFVKIDRSMLEQIQSPQPKIAPKIKPKPKKAVQKPMKKATPPKKKPEKRQASPVVNTPKPKKTAKRVSQKAKATKHAKAGGGFGTGNVKNRNVNQSGLLSVLSGTSSAVTSNAMAAAVTNLDAVKVPGVTENNFSVGGLKGALGDGKISVAAGPIIETKGSAQVLRSAGAQGKGEVAALARGTTGKKRVQAMVTAKMNRTVKIEGGMSRAMVKKVIDQHLDEITYCYETALMTNPSILGRVVFEWKILKSGQVGQVHIVSSSVNSNQIHDCIRSAIRSWQFPKPVGAEVVVSYPFVFDLVSF